MKIFIFIKKKENDVYTHLFFIFKQILWQFNQFLMFNKFLKFYFILFWVRKPIIMFENIPLFQKIKFSKNRWIYRWIGEAGSAITKKWKFLGRHCIFRGTSHLVLFSAGFLIFWVQIQPSDHEIQALGLD